jgi:hypothetical protein
VPKKRNLVLKYIAPARSKGKKDDAHLDEFKIDELPKRLYVFRGDLDHLLAADIQKLAEKLADYDEDGHLVLLPIGSTLELYEVIDEGRLS